MHKTLQEIINNCHQGIRAVSVSEKADKGTYFIAFGHLIINPQDFDALEDKTCKYPVIDIRNESNKYH